MVKTRSMTMSLSGRASSLKKVNEEDRAAAAAKVKGKGKEKEKEKEKVIELEDYKKVEITHEELLKAQAIFRELHLKDLKAEKEKRKFAYEAELYYAELKYRWICRKLNMKRQVEEIQEREKQYQSLGCIFRPSDGLLVDYYLRNQSLGKTMSNSPIVEVDVYECRPQHLIEKYLHTGENVWYFFTRSRPNEDQRGASDQGRWVSGKKSDILYEGKKVGAKQVLEYYEGDQKTKYKIIEYELEPPANTRKYGLFVCKLYEEGKLCSCVESTLI